MQSQGILLTYGDCTIRQREIDAFKEGNWLNDEAIFFYYEYLRNIYKEETKEINLIDPATVTCILNENDANEINTNLAPLKLSQYSKILFPLNDSQDVKSFYSGSHWALLVYEKAVNKWEIWNSMGSSQEMIKNSNHVINLTNVGADENGILSESQLCQKQINSYDCGMYVLANSELIVKYRGKSNSLLYEAKEITPQYISQMRKKIHNLLIKLISEKKKI